jgi:alpha-L-rhamnosidase
MKHFFNLLLFVFNIHLCFSQPSEVRYLRCEYMDNPLGLDAEQPRLTWQLSDSRQGAVQTAYRVLVGTDSALVAAGEGNSWNSGKIKSNDVRVVYSGKELQAFTRYYWNVECWDMHGKPLKSPVSFFETGFMQKVAWKGSWISDGTDVNTSLLSGKTSASRNWKKRCLEVSTVAT